MTFSHRTIWWFRHFWFRLMISIVCALMAGYFVHAHDNLDQLRNQACDGLQSTLFLFGLMLVFAAFLMNNYISGIRSTTLQVIREVRQSLWTVYDEVQKSQDPAARKLLAEDLLPLMKLGRSDWFQPDNFKSWANIRPKVEGIKGITIVLRHLLPLEESFSELGLCYIRSVAAELHLKSTASVVYLLVTATLINVTARLIPHTWLLNIIIFVVCVAIILLILQEVLHIFSFVRQGVGDELEDFLRADKMPTEEDNLTPKVESAG
jgi:hypothetical protein